MDLAPRSLLADRGITVDLLAPASIRSLFDGDLLFGKVFADPAEARGRSYDFAIVDSRSWKALKAKRRAWPTLPWVSVKGDYLPYDYHRALLATRRLSALLGVRLEPEAEAAHARQKLVLRDEAASPSRRLPPQVALALGGVRAERTYDRWPEVAARLHAGGIDRFVLLGSGNGRAMAEAVRQRLPEESRTDLVARTDLHRTRAAMAESSLVLAADGGLMHLALTTPTPVLALFDAGIDPAWRLPPGFVGRALRAGTRNVNAIGAADVVAAALALLPQDSAVLGEAR
jgi:heptosyltransferase-2